MGKNFKVGDVVKVSELYSEADMRGMVGTVTHVMDDGGHDSFCVEFDGWEEGHSGEFDDGRESCWYFGANMLDLVSEEHDSHYQTRIQPIETMQANMTPEEFQGFCKGCIIKYACRCGRKDEPLKEAEKIVDYAKWLVASLKGEIINPHNEEGSE